MSYSEMTEREIKEAVIGVLALRGVAVDYNDNDNDLDELELDE